ncbi:MAG: hypothetical protein WD556_09535 [Actinomycetota bacterium]
MTAWLPRLLLAVGVFFLVVGVGAFVGHVLEPSEAGTPELGRFGGWILDAMSFGVGFGALWLRRRLLVR